MGIQSRKKQNRIPPTKIPQWAEGRTITVMAGIEPFLIYSPTKNKWYKKITRCNLCGKCCMNVRLDWPYRTDEGPCKHLKKETWNFEPYNGQEVYACKKTFGLIACIARNVPFKLHPDCVVEYEEVK